MFNNASQHFWVNTQAARASKQRAPSRRVSAVIGLQIRTPGRLGRHEVAVVCCDSSGCHWGGWYTWSLVERLISVVSGQSLRLCGNHTIICNHGCDQAIRQVLMEFYIALQIVWVSLCDALRLLPAVAQLYCWIWAVAALLNAAFTFCSLLYLIGASLSRDCVIVKFQGW